MSVPFLDTRRDIALYRDEYLACAARVLDSGIFSLGPEVEAFENAFAAYIGTEYAVAVSSGTAALYASYLALGIGPGDEVMVPANSFIATAEAVVMAGAKPVFADVDAQTGLLTLETIQAAYTASIKAITVVHLYGRCLDLREIDAWAKQKGIPIIEDVAQAHGAVSVTGSHAGAVGSMGCFSFYPTKNLGAIGEGGIVVTSSKEQAKILKSIRLHGMGDQKYIHERFGTNLKMEALQGAFLSARLARLDAGNERRRTLAARYRDGLRNLPLTLPENVGEQHVYHLFVVHTDKRDMLQAWCHSKGIGVAVHYPIPLPKQGSMQVYVGAQATYPVAEHLASTALSLPLFPELRDEEVDEVIASVRSFFL
ncbi:DegT/DnrJ/EryC1/StrS family aminotransferase [Patescibacteria group bacterium]|nr:DegT/DnrJ/EryC1/StrS family aminotransferase [Patescibacteria group bacterium]MBP9709709.1 DegT/DnrJ/EryC1/StrS family aminotransferase [Patescibacteria group bacterium]